MRLILSLLSLFTVCTLVHSNTIYRKYREIELPLVPSDEINKEQNIIVPDAELKKDQIPVHIEMIEPVVILNENKPIESARNVNLEPEIVLPVAEDETRIDQEVSELVVAPEKIIEVLKESEPELAVEQVRSIESVEPLVELKKDESVQLLETPAESEQVVPEVASLVVETVKNIETEEKQPVVKIVEIQAPSVRNIEAEVPAAEEAVIEQVIVPVVVPVEKLIVEAESVRNLEAVGEIVPEVMRKIEQAEEIAAVDAEKQSEILNEIIAKETVRNNIEPEIVNVVESVVPNVVVIEEVAIVSVPKEELRSAVPELVEEKIVEVQEKKVEEEVLKEELKEELKDELLKEELLKEENQGAKEEVKPKEEIVLRSVELVDLKPKQDEKKEQLLEKDEKLQETKLEEKLDLKENLNEPLKEELKPKDENELRAVDEIVPEVQKVDEQKSEIVLSDKVDEKLLVNNQDESIGSVRQTAESTTPGNVIQQLLQNNPLTNFIQSIRPQSAAAQPPASVASDEKPSAELNATPAPVAPVTQPPNFIQQIASGIQGGIQGFQANVQGFLNGGQQPATGSATTRPPFAFIQNLFPGQQSQQAGQGGTNPPTGGNVPPNPIQGFLGLFNGNRVSTTQNPTTTTLKPTAPATVAAAAAPQPALVDDKIDAVKDSAEETEISNENYAESEQELYVGEEGDSPGLY